MARRSTDPSASDLRSALLQSLTADRGGTPASGQASGPRIAGDDAEAEANVVADAQADAPATSVVADELTAKKREENEAWLNRLGTWVWVGALLATVLVVAITLLTNQAPAASATIDRTLVQAKASAAEVAAVVGNAGVDQSVRMASVTRLAGTLGKDGAALAASAAELPSTWNGLDLATAAEDVRTNAEGLSATAAAMALEAAKDPASADAIRASADKAQGFVTAIAAIDLAPGWTWPWGFDNQVAAGLVYAWLLTLALLALLSAALHASGGLRRYLIGGDGRFSTSQTQAALWTVALFFLLAHLLLRPNPGAIDQLDESYLLLLGGPFAAWVIGGAITRNKIENQDIQKVTSPEAQVKDLITDDDGRANLTDTQFFAFSMLALVVVVFAFFRDPSQLPDIPLGLAMLTGAAALVYTGKKALDRNAPVVFNVAPASGTGKIHGGDVLVITGANFVPAGAGSDIDVLMRVVVRFKKDATTIDAPVIPVLPDTPITKKQQVRKLATNPRSDRLEVTAPDAVGAGQWGVSVVTAAGLESPPVLVSVAAKS